MTKTSHTTYDVKRTIWLVWQIDFDRLENSLSGAITRRILGCFETQREALDYIPTLKHNVYQGWNNATYPRYDVESVKCLGPSQPPAGKEDPHEQ